MWWAAAPRVDLVNFRTGNFSPSTTTLNATYAPSVADITAGHVTLTLTTTGQPAPALPTTAQVVVTFFSSQQTITVPPSSQTVCAGSPATFSVTATGGDTTYQWQVSLDGGATFNNTSVSDTNAQCTPSRAPRWLLPPINTRSSSMAAAPRKPPLPQPC